MPEEVKPFYNDFLEEGGSRGVTIKVENLLVRYESIPTEDGIPICGATTGTITGEERNIIRIDTTCTAWKHSRLSREVLLFHEFGHALLLRTDDDSQLGNKDWKSMMYSGNWFVTEYYIEKTDRRDYYLDELFDPNTPEPDWAK